jgi:hypothetical protein
MKAVPSLAVGFTAGALSTVAMTVVMLGAKRAGVTGELPPERITRRAIAAVSAQPPDDHHEDAIAAVAHLGFGAVAGALFGVLTTRTAAAPGSPAFAAITASSWHHAARIPRPAWARRDDACRPLGLRRRAGGASEALPALALGGRWSDRGRPGDPR